MLKNPYTHTRTNNTNKEKKLFRNYKFYNNCIHYAIADWITGFRLSNTKLSFKPLCENAIWYLELQNLIQRLTENEYKKKKKEVFMPRQTTSQSVS